MTDQKFIDLTGSQPLTTYSQGSVYNSAGDNAPFTSMEARDIFLAAVHQSSGLIQIGIETTLLSASVAAQPDYTLVFLDNSGNITPISTTGTIPTSSVVGMIYPVESSGSVAYTYTSGLNQIRCYYVIVFASMLSLPIGTAVTSSIWGYSSWTLPSEGSRSYNTIEVGDYVYYNALSGQEKLVAFPKDALVSTMSGSLGTILSDSASTPNFIKLGVVLAKTNTEYIVEWGTNSTYGTGVNSTSSHTLLSDISSQTSGGPETWVNSHYGYAKRIISIPSSQLTGTTPTIGQLVEMVGSSNTSLQGKFRISTNDPGSVLLGIYIDADVYGNHYILKKGEWDPTASGFNANVGALSITSADLGKTIWDAGDSTAGTATLTSPFNPSTLSASTAKSLGYIYAISSTDPYIRVEVQNGINAALDHAVYLYSNNTAPSADISNLQIQEQFGTVSATAGWSTFTPLADTDIFRYGLNKLYPDASIHLCPLLHDLNGGGTVKDWFSLSESSFYNDLNWDMGNTSLTKPSTFDNYQVNPIQNSNSTDSNPTTVVAGEDIWQGPGVNGSFRNGCRDWNSCQGDTSGITLTGITATTSSGVTSLNFTSSSSIYWFKDTIVDSQLSTPLPMNFPLIGVMMLVHDVASTEAMAMIFSYEGYSGWNTTSFTFNNVNILNMGTLVTTPNWTTTAGGSWNGGATPTATGWKLLPMPVGGLRVRLKGTATFDSLSVAAPNTWEWYKFKKSGNFALGSSITGGAIGNSVLSGWDLVDDTTSTRWFSGLTNAATIATNYDLDYTPATSTTVFTKSDLDTAVKIGCLHRAYPHPGNISATMSGSAVGSIALVSGTTDEYEFTSSGGTDPAAAFVSTGKTSSILGTRLDLTISGGTATNGTYEGLLITGISSSNLRFRCPTAIVASLVGTVTSGTWALWTTNDDIVHLPSLLFINDRELWVDLSKKSAYRAYSLLFSVSNAQVSDTMELTVAQSAFNNSQTYLRSMVIGTEIFKYLTEGERVQTFIQPRLTSPSLIQM